MNLGEISCFSPKMVKEGVLRILFTWNTCLLFSRVCRDFFQISHFSSFPLIISHPITLDTYWKSLDTYWEKSQGVLKKVSSVNQKSLDTFSSKYPDLFEFIRRVVSRMNGGCKSDLLNHNLSSIYIPLCNAEHLGRKYRNKNNVRYKCTAMIHTDYKYWNCFTSLIKREEVNILLPNLLQ